MVKLHRLHIMRDLVVDISTKAVFTIFQKCLKLFRRVIFLLLLDFLTYHHWSSANTHYRWLSQVLLFIWLLRGFSTPSGWLISFQGGMLHLRKLIMWMNRGGIHNNILKLKILKLTLSFSFCSRRANRTRTRYSATKLFGKWIYIRILLTSIFPVMVEKIFQSRELV
jgi:hypothetical protein